MSLVDVGRQLSLLQHKPVQLHHPLRHLVLLREVNEPPRSRDAPDLVADPAECPNENALLNLLERGWDGVRRDLVFENEGADEGEEGEGDGVRAGELLVLED